MVDRVIDFRNGAKPARTILESEPHMIVRSVDQGWTVVFHTTHGLLAQRIASCLHDARELPYWFETQVAIGLHDDLHRVFEKGEREYLTEAGAPRDFTLVPMQDDKRAAETQNRIDEAFRKHSWLGVLQSKHADCLYRGEDTTPEMQQMLDGESQRREAALTRLRIEPTLVQKTYDWMHLCDRLSLILCGDDVPAMHRRLEIITNVGGTRFELWQDDTECIRIAPWPFADETVTLSVEYRTLKQLSYADDAELGEALKACPVEVRTIVMSDGAIGGADKG